MKMLRAGILAGPPTLSALALDSLNDSCRRMASSFQRRSAAWSSQSLCVEMSSSLSSISVTIELTSLTIKLNCLSSSARRASSSRIRYMEFGADEFIAAQINSLPAPISLRTEVASFSSWMDAESPTDSWLAILASSSAWHWRSVGRESRLRLRILSTVDEIMVESMFVPTPPSTEMPATVVAPAPSAAATTGANAPAHSIATRVCPDRRCSESPEACAIRWAVSRTPRCISCSYP